MMLEILAYRPVKPRLRGGRLDALSAACAAAICLIAGSAAVEAATVTFAFTGTIHTVLDDLGALDGSIAQGTAISGTYTFDTDTPNSAGPVTSGEQGLYRHEAPPAGVQFVVGNLRFRSTAAEPQFDVIINNDFGFAGSDEYGFRSAKNEALGLSTTEGLARLNVGWFVQTLDYTALDSVALTAVPPDLSRFGSGGHFVIEGEGAVTQGPDNLFRIEGELASLTVVPEPAGVAMAAMAAVLLIARYRARGARKPRIAELPASGSFRPRCPIAPGPQA